MRKLVEITSHPELVAQVMAQFAFMITMAEKDDPNFEKLQELNLQDIFQKADQFFCEYTDDLGMIMTEECGLTEKITEFLKEWEEVVDVTAIQQNIHYHLLLIDEGTVEVLQEVFPKKEYPKKLIRDGVIPHLKEGETEIITDPDKLNELYQLKLREEMEEIKASNHEDIMEFVDLVEVARTYAQVNGFGSVTLDRALNDKRNRKGIFGNVVLNKLNPNNSSNDLYFKESYEEKLKREAVDEYIENQKAQNKDEE